MAPLSGCKKLMRTPLLSPPQLVLDSPAMSTRVVLAVAAALSTGIAIALQTTMNGRAGAVIGPIRTGVLVNATGGSMALGMILLAIVASRVGLLPSQTVSLAGRSASPGEIMRWVAFAGLMGILIIVGISFSVQGVGVTAGLAAIILSQLLAGLIIDSLGGAGGVALAINPRRIGGVLAMAVGVWLLVPRTS